MLAFCSSPRFVEHETVPNHPERPDRIRAIYRAVCEARLIASANPFADFKLDLGNMPTAGPPLLELEPTAAELKWLLEVHPLAHVERVKHVASLNGVLDQGDTPSGPRSFDTALLAVGAALECCDAVVAGRAKRAFAAVRPPGHHAEPDRAMGFCLFSNIALAARYLQRRHGLDRIAIVDFDVHHGNGTQAVFESDPSVLFVSLHQDPRTCYPGSGYEYEVGDGPGRGYTINIPLPPGSGNEEYLAAMESRVIPAVDRFGPECLLISAGFDAHREDPLAQMQVNDEGFELMTRQLVAVAEQCCGGRIVSLLEGGYCLAALGRGVVRHLAAMNV
jgi:acetoin utilization deacetylase AcuC-like enzyme